MEYNITYRQKDKGWQYIISYKVNNKWKQKSKQGFKSKKEAKPFADEMLEQLKLDCKYDINTDYKDINFKDFSDMHLGHLKLYSEYSTIVNYECALKQFKALNDFELKKITRLHIQSCVDNMTKNNIKSSTIKGYLGKISVLFRAAVEEYNIILFSPATNIKIKNIDPPAIKQALNNDELNTLLNSITKPEYYIIALLASKCGFRIGEIVGLTWGDIDFKNNLININKQWKQDKDTGLYKFGSLKSNNSRRIVPFSVSVKNKLTEYQEYSVKNFDGRLFSFTNTSYVAMNMKYLFKKLKFNISIHELRHTYATKLLYSGIDFKTVAKLMGHDVKETMQTYSHVNDDMMNNAISIINSVM